jgi:hypothetical protein
MLRRIGEVVLDGVRFVVGNAAMLGALAWVMVSRKKDDPRNEGPYAIVPVLLAPIITLHVLRLRRIRVPRLELAAVYRALGALSAGDRALVAHMVARENREHMKDEALRSERRSYPLSPIAPERYLYSTRVPNGSIGALLASPSGWLRGDLGPLRIEAVLPEIVIDEVGEPHRQLSALVAVGDRRFLLTHALDLDDVSLSRPATADRTRATAAAADLAGELAARKESVLATRFDRDRQWLTPLLDALAAAPDIAALEPPAPAWAPQVSEASVEAGARLLAEADPAELDREDLGVGEAEFAFAFGEHRIYLCEDGAVVLAHTGEPPPVIVKSAEGLAPAFPVDGSAARVAALRDWLVRSLERRGGAAGAVAWLQALADHQDEPRPWLFIPALPWVELDEATLARHEHEVRVLHRFLRAAIDPDFDPRVDPRAEVLAARAAANEYEYL